jgi:sugar/nucleoside kinase (ribokinase family)
MDRVRTLRVPAEPARVVDSTGAGDAFDAGLLVAWLAGAGPLDALRAGVAAGARAVGRAGARP